MGLFRKNKLDKEWLDWLSDEPPAAEVQAHKQWVKREQNVAVRPSEAARNRIRNAGVREPIPAQKPVQEASQSKNISIDINFKKPDLSALKTNSKRLYSKLPATTLKQRKILAITLAALVLITVGFKVFGGSKSGNDPTDLQNIQTEKPSFDTVLPDNKEVETSSGKLQYDPEKQVASFTDEIEFVPVTVSQQPLPESFKADPTGELTKLAEKISATEAINESNPKAYLGTSAKGPQTAIFVKNNLLVFIYSQRKIDKSGWAEYITKLQ